MKLSKTIALGLTFFAIAGIVGYIVKSSKTKQMLKQISDEGYETAQDILFPGKSVRSKNLHFGPVIPVYNVIQEG